MDKVIVTVIEGENKYKFEFDEAPSKQEIQDAMAHVGGRPSDRS